MYAEVLIYTLAAHNLTKLSLASFILQQKTKVKQKPVYIIEAM